MIYTCYDMVRDCRANRAEGWTYFLSNYVSVIRRVLEHYEPQRAGELLPGVLARIARPQSSIFESMEPVPERMFVAKLRQQVLASIEEHKTSEQSAFDLDLLREALEPLTLVEKQASWFETMRYPPEKTGAMLRMEPKTVEKIRNKAGELLRGKLDTWRRTLLFENGRAVGREAAAAETAECLPAKVFLDVLDGRSTWQGREEMERHASGCWHCIDHFCRLVEVVELLRGNHPLSEPDLRDFRQALGLPSPRPQGWKRWFAGQS